MNHFKGVINKENYLDLAPPFKYAGMIPYLEIQTRM